MNECWMLGSRVWTGMNECWMRGVKIVVEGSPSSLCPRSLVGATPARLLLAAIDRCEPSATPSPLRRDPRAVHPRALPRAQAQHRPRPVRGPRLRGHRRQRRVVDGDLVVGRDGTLSTLGTPSGRPPRHPPAARALPVGGRVPRRYPRHVRSLRVHRREHVAARLGELGDEPVSEEPVPAPPRGKGPVRRVEPALARVVAVDVVEKRHDAGASAIGVHRGRSPLRRPGGPRQHVARGATSARVRRHVRTEHLERERVGRAPVVHAPRGGIVEERERVGEKFSRRFRVMRVCVIIGDGHRRARRSRR
mmetsp:Transcript_183/g.780  ORF Transcript_183/g.780 Transcript_183/m.780 type:complete len:306 (+) Transcript_183:727-1644(+)